MVWCGMVCTFSFFDVCVCTCIYCRTRKSSMGAWLYGCINELQVLFSGSDPCSAANPLLPATAGRLPATLLGRLAGLVVTYATLCFAEPAQATPVPGTQRNSAWPSETVDFSGRQKC